MGKHNNHPDRSFSFKYLETDIVESYEDHIIVFQSYSEGGARAFILTPYRQLIQTRYHRTLNNCKIWSHGYINRKQQALKQRLAYL